MALTPCLAFGAVVLNIVRESREVAYVLQYSSVAVGDRFSSFSFLLFAGKSLSGCGCVNVPFASGPVVYGLLLTFRGDGYG
jgi:hypothetical protein